MGKRIEAPIDSGWSRYQLLPVGAFFIWSQRAMETEGRNTVYQEGSLGQKEAPIQSRRQ
jgi:hypothetical protein